VDGPVAASVAVSARPLPDDLAAEVLWPEHGVEQQLQVVARGRVAMEVERSGRLQNPTQLNQSGRHHREVGEHVARPEERAKGEHGLGNLSAHLDGLLVRSGRLRVPLPRVLEGFDLR